MRKKMKKGLSGLDEYQETTLRYDTFPGFYDGTAKYSKDGIMVATEKGLIEKVLGLPGEAGEAADKFKKIIRDKGGVISTTDREEIVKELGDVMWYVASIARYMDMPLSEVASLNVEKLRGRLRRGTVHGEGDER